MKMIKNLTAQTVKNIPGFTRMEEMDYEGSYNTIRFFDYKGMKLTATSSDGYVYISFLVGSIFDEEEKWFTGYDWGQTEASKMVHDFVGVKEFDLDKLIETCEKIIADAKELNESIEHEMDMEPVFERIDFEKAYLEGVLEQAERKVCWWKADSYHLKKAKDGYDRIKREIENLEELKEEIFVMDWLRRREKVQHLERKGYVRNSLGTDKLDMVGWAIEDLMRVMEA